MPRPSQNDSPPRISLRAAWTRLRHARAERAGRLYALVGLTAVLLLAESLSQLALPWVFSRMVAGLSNATQWRVLPVELVAIYGILMLLRASFSSLQEVAYQPVSLRLQSIVAEEGLRHLHALSLRFHLERQTGALIRTIDRATDAVDTLLRLTLFNVGPSLLNCGLTLGVVLQVFGSRYAIVIFIGLVGYAAVARWSTQRRVAARRLRNEASSAAQHRLVDSLMNFEAVRHFSAEGHEMGLFVSARRRLEAASLRMARIAAVAGILRNAIIAAMTALVLWFAMRDIAAGRLHVSEFVLIGTYIRNLYMAVFSLNSVHAGWRNARVDLEHWQELLARDPDVAAPAQPHRIATSLDDGGAADLVFDHVGFAYIPERPVLERVSFHARPGWRVGIVGATGSGKTTIGKLLLRAYDVGAGEIRIDGVPLAAIAREDLAALIGVVPQETPLFNDTLAYNIGYGRLGASQAEIEAAAHAAALHDFIASLPDGYETRVGERGLKLSGGEKQRVAIARVILRNPRLLLLDEATSALDTRTEERISAALDGLTRARTTVIIAHRLSTIIGCDEILVLEDGRVVERGTHAELLARDGAYARMWAAQADVEGWQGAERSERIVSGIDATGNW